MDNTTVGVDLAKNVFVACVADCTGRIMARREFNRAGFLTWLGTLPAGTVIGIEACGSASSTTRKSGNGPERNRAMAKHISDRRTGQTDQQTQLANEWLT